MTGLLVVTPVGPEADILCANLKDHGFEVFCVSTGAEAVSAAARRRPAVILMDPALSAMDRWHAVKRLNTEISTSRIPVLTLGADATSPAGLQRVLTKIERTIGRLPTPDARKSQVIRNQPPPQSPPPASVRLSRPPTSSPSAPPLSDALRPPGDSSATPVMPPRREVDRPSVILVVDDNALNRDMLSRRLQRRGYEVMVAEDGAQALRMIDEQDIDLVLLDWMMPGLSGIDVLNRVRQTRSQVELPVIMATAKTEAEDVVEALKAEANDYVTKPLNFDIVHARILTQLNLARAHRELLVSERRFRALLENTGDMIVQYEPNGRVQYVSSASRILLGHEPEALKRRSFYDWIHPIDRRELEEQQRNGAALPDGFTFIARMQRQDGPYIWVETSCRVLREGGELLVQAACRDVTEHMESLSGDEPPLPLGGDIMAHPGWRGGSARPAPDRVAGPSGEASQEDLMPTPVAAPARRPVIATPVLVLTTLEGLSLEMLDNADGEVARRVAHLLLQAAAKGADGGV